MTTNKPEVAAWLHEARQDSDVITDKVRYVWGTPRGSVGAYSIPLIRLSDYEALQAECEALRKDAERYRWLRDGCDQKVSEATRIATHCYGLEWDSRIDAAMAKEAHP